MDEKLDKIESKPLYWTNDLIVECSDNGLPYCKESIIMVGEISSENYRIEFNPFLSNII